MMPNRYRAPLNDPPAKTARFADVVCKVRFKFETVIEDDFEVEAKDEKEARTKAEQEISGPTDWSRAEVKRRVVTGETFGD